MDPSSKNWLSLFVDEFQDGLKSDCKRIVRYLESHNTSIDLCHFYLHTSGLFYGHVIGYKMPSYSDSALWSESDKVKIALTEGMFLSYLLTQKKRLVKIEEDEYDGLLSECIQKIYDFYVLFSVQDEQNRKFRNLLSKSSEVISTVEQILDYRVSNPTMLKLGFWKGAQFNIISSLDILYFSLWLQGQYAYNRRVYINTEIVQLMNSICRKNSESAKNGKLILSYFIASRNYDEPLQEEYLETSFDYELSKKNDQYIIRLLLYEYAAYTYLIDSSLTFSETLFLQELGRNLDLNEDDALESMMTIENFLITEGEKIFYLQYGEGLEMIKQSFLNRWQTFITKNKSKIISEILESKELVELLRKSVSEDLSAEEKQKVKEQILDLLKTIPSVAIFMIPGGAVILPILLKILPEEILMPSSFLNKKSEK
ncbi:MAG: LETM1 domain-containing protein [Bacteroidales bacterium]|nr:LETM1 domain-containing protein [Bacteroidales bacterium]